MTSVPGAVLAAAPVRGRPRVRRIAVLTLRVAAGLVLATTSAAWFDRVVTASWAPGLGTRMPALGEIAWPEIGLPAAVLLAGSTVRAPAGRWRRAAGLVAVTAVCAVTASVAFPMCQFMVGWSARPTEVLRSPGGAHVVRVYEGADLIDPLWSVRVTSDRPGPDLETELACLNGDSELNALAAVSWSGADSLRIETEGGSLTEVDVDPTTGRPSATGLSFGC